MFKIGSGRLTWIAVKWPGLLEDGTPTENEVRLQVELVDASRLGKQVAAEKDGADGIAFAKEVAKGWEGVGDKDGVALPFTPENFALLLEAPGFGSAFGQAYVMAWNGISGIREKNSVASPDDGQPAGEQARKPAA